MILSTNVEDRLSELLDKLQDNGKTFKELADATNTSIVRDLMTCKSKRLFSFSYVLKSNLLHCGMLPSKPDDLRPQRFMAINRAPLLKPGQAIAIGSQLEKVLLSAYCRILQEPLPPDLIRVLKDQHSLIDRCNQSVSLLIPDIVNMWSELPKSNT